jgi:hypothetical protein
MAASDYPGARLVMLLFVVSENSLRRRSLRASGRDAEKSKPSGMSSCPLRICPIWLAIGPSMLFDAIWGAITAPK